MRLIEITQRLFSRTTVSIASKATLGLETFEDRVVPAVTIPTVADANGIIQVTNAGAVGSITIQTNGADGLRIIGTGSADKTYVAGTFKAVNVVATDASAITVINPGADNLAAITSLKQITVTGNSGNDTFNFAGATNPNIYYNVDLKGGANTFAAADGGVNVLTFTPSVAPGSITFTPSASSDSKVGMSFKGVSDAVQVNLNANPGTQFASYTNMSVTLAAAKTADTVLAVYGGKGNDNLIGNAKDNYFIGGAGDDILIGGAGNDQLNATRDFSPAIAGTTAGAAAVVVDGTTVVDLTKLAGAKTKFATLQGTGAGGLTGSNLYNTFAGFNFNEGAAYLRNAAGANTDAAYAGFANEDFGFANGIVVDGVPTQDFLYGNDGNDGIYGFNGTSVTGYGQAGNDVFSTNLKGLAGTFDGGVGDDLLIGASGFTVIGGDGNDDLSFVLDPASTALTYAIGGAGDDKITAAGKFFTIDASQGTDVVTVSNEANVVLIYVDATSFPTTPLANLPLVQKARR